MPEIQNKKLKHSKLGIMRLRRVRENLGGLAVRRPSGE
jgi:hypothetical protein